MVPVATGEVGVGPWRQPAPPAQKRSAVRATAEVGAATVVVPASVVVGMGMAEGARGATAATAAAAAEASMRGS